MTLSTGGNSVLNATVTGNLVTQPDSFAFAGIWVLAGSGSGTENQVINLVLGDVSTAAVAGSPTGSLQNDFTNGDPAMPPMLFSRSWAATRSSTCRRPVLPPGRWQAVVQDDNVGTPVAGSFRHDQLVTAQTVRLIAAPISVYEDGATNITYTFLRYGDTSAR